MCEEDFHDKKLYDDFLKEVIDLAIKTGHLVVDECSYPIGADTPISRVICT